MFEWVYEGSPHGSFLQTVFKVGPFLLDSSPFLDRKQWMLILIKVNNYFKSMLKNENRKGKKENTRCSI